MSEINSGLFSRTKNPVSKTRFFETVLLCAFFLFRWSFSLCFKGAFLYFIMIFISLRGKRRNRIWILSMPKSVARNKVDPARGSGQNIKILL